MDKVGFIGYGHMGSVLLKSLLAARALRLDQIIVATRTQARLDELTSLYPAVEITQSSRQVAQKSSLLFLCVGTYQVMPVLLELRDALHDSLHLVAISGGLEIASLERLFAGPITRVMPTIISEVQEGVTLVCHNRRVSRAQQAYLSRLLGRIGQVKIIREDQFELAADFTSCAPGLLASIFEQFVQAGLQESDFTYAELSDMFLPTISGTVELLLKRKENFKDLTSRVATRGGATEGGVAVLEASLPDVFGRVLAATLQRHAARKQVTRQQFEELA